MAVTSMRARQGDGRRLIGRQHELSRLDSTLDQLRAGTPRFLEIVGEPGIGKTRLLAELCARAEGNGHLVLASRAEELAREAPFKVVVDALDDHLAPRLDHIHPSCIGLLATIFPSVAGRSPRSAVEARAERYRLHRAVRLTLEALAPPGGLVLAFDEVHWADPASVGLLAYLLRHPPRGPVLVALAYRPRQAEPRLLSALAGASHVGGGMPLVERLDIGPLTIEEAGEFLEPGMTRSRRRTLYVRSGGNPLYLEAFARSAAGTASKLVGGSGTAEVCAMPPAVHAALRSEFDTLSAVAQVVAQAAAVAGDPFEPEVTAAVAEVSEADALMAIDELVDRDLARPAGTRRFRYRHQLVRQVVYEAAGQGWRLAAHARAADALAARGASVVQRAHHIERAARPGDETAIAMLVDAARQTMDRAPATSAHWLSAAVRLLPHARGRGEAPHARAWAEVPHVRDRGSSPHTGGRGEDPPHDQAGERRLELLVDLARALGLAGQLQESRDTLYEVLRLLPSERSSSRVAAATSCALAERLLGRHVDSRALLLRELRGLPDQASPQAAALQLGIASTSQMEGDIEAACGWAERALAVTRSAPDRLLHTAVVGFLAHAYSIAGDIDRAMGSGDEAAALIDALPDGGLARRLPAIIWLAWGELSIERYHDALRHLARGLMLARETGQGYVLSYLLAGTALAHRSLGDLSEAAASGSDAVEAAEMLGSDELRTLALAVQCRVAVSSGDVDLALRASTEAVEAAGSVNDHGAAFALAALGEARLAAGDPAGCVQAIVEADGGRGLARIARPLRAEFFEILVRAEHARGCASAASAWADCAEADLPPGLVAPKGFALLARARTLATVDPRAAAERALAAAAAFGEVGHQVDEGQAHLLAGTVLASAGERIRARDEFNYAGKLFAGAGARGLSEQTVREQRRLGPRVPRDARGHDARLLALSPRELEIARLVSKGRTNQQIARQLGSSCKTVETHLSRIFAKLDVPSRAAVASAVARAQTQPPT